MRNLKLFWLTRAEMDKFNCPCRKEPHRDSCPDMRQSGDKYACAHPCAPRYKPVHATVATAPYHPTCEAVKPSDGAVGGYRAASKEHCDIIIEAKQLDRRFNGRY